MPPFSPSTSIPHALLSPQERPQTDELDYIECSAPGHPASQVQQLTQELHYNTAHSFTTVGAYSQHSAACVVCL
jgi:hypothetical protein